MHWKVLTGLLCSFGFMKEMRPSEAFLTLFLTGEWKNLTIGEVNNEIYPWWTYSYLIWLVPVFLLTDFLRYKPVLILDGAAAIGAWSLLLWTQGVTAMKCVEVFYGLFTAGEVAYFAFLYVEVPKEHFKKISSFTRAATLIGKFVSFLLAQILYSFNVLDYYDLHIFSFVSLCLAFIIPLILPWPAHSEIFHRANIDSNRQTNQTTSSDINKASSSNDADKDRKEMDVPDNQQNKPMGQASGCLNGFRFMWSEMKDVYTSQVVLVWSVWWAIASCGNFQILNYVQNLWVVISSKNSHGDEKDVYNGAVEAASTLLGTFHIQAIKQPYHCFSLYYSVSFSCAALLIQHIY